MMAASCISWRTRRRTPCYPACRDRCIIQRICESAGNRVRHFRERRLVHPVTAVDLEFLIHAEAEPSLEQADAVGADDNCDNGIGIRRDRGDRRAVVFGPDRVPYDLRYLATEFLVGLHDAKRHFVTPGVV